MACPPKAGYTEEDYYYSEWTAAERENGEHLSSFNFVRLPPHCRRAVVGAYSQPALWHWSVPAQAVARHTLPWEREAWTTADVRQCGAQANESKSQRGLRRLRSEASLAASEDAKAVPTTV